MTLSTTHIRESITLTMVAATGFPKTPSVFSYTSADPFAVKIEFGGPAPATWLIARDLLREGLRRPVGVGDVRIWPTTLSSEVFYLALQTPKSQALLEGPRRLATAFLARTDALVPPGTEETHMVMDAELGKLFLDGDIS